MYNIKYIIQDYLVRTGTVKTVPYELVTKLTFTPGGINIV